MDDLKQIRRLQEKISVIYYNANLTPSEKQEQIKHIEREIAEIKERV